MDNLYYSSTGRQRRRRGFFTPFLIILCIMVILVLIVQIITSLKMRTNETKRNQAFMYIERGDIEFQPWGEEVWHDAYNQALIWEGDRIRTDKDSYAVIGFYDGSRVRINEGTEMLVEKIEADKKSIEVELRLVSGEIWLNELSTDDNLRFRVLTSHLDITSIGTRYAVASGEIEFVRVMDGDVKTMVYDNFVEDPELLDSVSVGVGQQISLSSVDIEALEARKFVNLLESTDDYWRVTEWYLWNIREDETPTVYKNEEAVDGQREGVPNADGEAIPEHSTDTVSSAASTVSAMPAPKVTVTNPPVSPYELTEQRIYLKGVVSLDVNKVIVTEFYEDPKGVPYQLSKFVPGSGTWNYAAGLDFGNLKPGKNRFVVQAYNNEGLVSDPVEVIINVPGGDAEPVGGQERAEGELALSDDENGEAVATTDETSGESAAGENTSSADSEETDAEASSIVEPATPTKSITKTTPVIVSVGDAEKTKENYFVTTADRVVINGSIGGARDVQKIIVNGWPLSLYTPGSDAWTYYAKSSINTLQRGINVYNVYTENSAGGRSLSLTFTIEKR